MVVPERKCPTIFVFAQGRIDWRHNPSSGRTKFSGGLLTGWEQSRPINPVSHEQVPVNIKTINEKILWNAFLH